MIKVNLIFPQYIDKLKQKTKDVQITIMLAAVAFVVIGITFLHINKAFSLERLLTKKQAELKTLQDKIDTLEEMEKTKRELAAHLNALEILLDKRFDYPYFMQDIARTIAKTIKFRSFRTTSDEQGEIEFDITAQAELGDDIGNWIKNMEEDKKFSSITLGAVGVERDEKSSKEMYYFPVLGNYFARPQAKQKTSETQDKTEQQAMPEQKK